MIVKRVRISIGIGEEILKEVDKTAKDMGLSRTGLISVAIKHYLDQDKALKFASDVKDLQKAIFSGKIRIEEVGMDNSAGD